MKKLILNIGCFIVASILVWALCRDMYLFGYKKGINIGYSEALDTVTKVCQEQIKSDTSITDLVIVNPDTIHFYLSRKTPISH